MCHDCFVTSLYLVTFCGLAFLASPGSTKLRQIASDVPTALFGGMTMLATALAMLTIQQFLSNINDLVMRKFAPEVGT